jgi:hypothetical protein
MESFELTFDELDALKRYEPVERDVRIAQLAQRKLWKYLNAHAVDITFHRTLKIPAKAIPLTDWQRLEAALGEK